MLHLCYLRILFRSISINILVPNLLFMILIIQLIIRIIQINSQ